MSSLDLRYTAVLGRKQSTDYLVLIVPVSLLQSRRYADSTEAGYPVVIQYVVRGTRDSRRLACDHVPGIEWSMR